jgi:hypothetical protein
VAGEKKSSKSRKPNQPTSRRAEPTTVQSISVIASTPRMTIGFNARPRGQVPARGNGAARRRTIARRAHRPRSRRRRDPHARGTGVSLCVRPNVGRRWADGERVIGRIFMHGWPFHHGAAYGLAAPAPEKPIASTSQGRSYFRRGLTAPGPRVSRWRVRVAAN